MKAAVDHELKLLLNAKVGEAQQLDSAYGDLLQTIATLVERGGKRLRPRLTLLAYEGFGGQSQAIVRVAASQELFHAFILMHDDIIDEDLQRWGGDNISGHYLKRFKKTLPTDRARKMADNWALLAGDICYSLSQEALLASDFPAKLLGQASVVMQQTLFTMVGGELMDVSLSLDQNVDYSQEQLLKICHYKTAVYSFVTPLQIGALLAGADAKQLARIEEFAVNLGIAFQLQDDLLGMFGDSSATGKPNLSDLQDGKQTLLVAKGLALANKTQKSTIKQLLGKPGADESDLLNMQSILISCGARQAVEKVAQTYLQSALKVLPTIGFSTKITQELGQLVAQTEGRLK